MSTELFRKYIDIVNESQQPVELDEGLINNIKDKVVAYARKMFSPQDMQQMKLAVEKATGKPIEQVSLRDIGGQNATKIASALGAKANAAAAANQDQLNEILGIEDPRVAQLRQRGKETGYELTPFQLKTAQDQFDYEKYGVTTSMLVRRILGFGSQIAGLGGVVTTIMGNTPSWAGLIALIAFLVGSLVAYSGDK